MRDLKDPRLMYLKAALFLVAGCAIEKYIDPSYKFAGLGSFVVYLFRRKLR